MASTAASVSPTVADTASEVSLVRLYVLRAIYLLLVVGLGAIIVPVLFSHEPMARGVIPSLLGAVWLLASSGHLPPTFTEDFTAIAAGVILMPIVIPWGYVYRHYVKQQANRWR